MANDYEAGIQKVVVVDPTGLPLDYEAGVQQIELNTDRVAAVETQLAEIMSQNNNTVTYGYDANGNIQTVTEKDPSNNVIQTVTYTYNTAGDVATSVTVANSKTVTTTYNYDANGNITSTSNVMS
jgi:YD repeat-containing protein